jgi:hypothetical protein
MSSRKRQQSPGGSPSVATILGPPELQFTAEALRSLDDAFKMHDLRTLNSLRTEVLLRVEVLYDMMELLENDKRTVLLQYRDHLLGIQYYDPALRKIRGYSASQVMRNFGGAVEHMRENPDRTTQQIKKVLNLATEGSIFRNNYPPEMYADTPGVLSLQAAQMLRQSVDFVFTASNIDWGKPFAHLSFFRD